MNKFKTPKAFTIIVIALILLSVLVLSLSVYIKCDLIILNEQEEIAYNAIKDYAIDRMKIPESINLYRVIITNDKNKKDENDNIVVIDYVGENSLGTKCRTQTLIYYNTETGLTDENYQIESEVFYTVAETIFMCYKDEDCKDLYIELNHKNIQKKLNKYFEK